MCFALKNEIRPLQWGGNEQIRSQEDRGRDSGKGGKKVGEKGEGGRETGNTNMKVRHTNRQINEKETARETDIEKKHWEAPREQFLTNTIQEAHQDGLSNNVGLSQVGSRGGVGSSWKCALLYPKYPPHALS